MRLVTIILTAFTCTFFQQSFSQNCNGLSGTYKIGPTGTFGTLTAALDTLSNRGVSTSVILELQSSYTSTAEVFPIRFRQVPCANSNRTITVRPEAGASGLTISSGHDTTTIDLNTGIYYILDGRSGGTGQAKNLLIRNTQTSGMAIRFINDARYNQLKHIDIKGVTRHPGRGVVLFSGTTRTQGNDFNRIDTCTVSDGNSTPAFCIYGAGQLPVNTGNVINGCHLYNFFSPDGESAAISLAVSMDSTEITGNSIYQTIARNYDGPNGGHPAGIVAGGFQGGHLITNNHIGGTAPLAGGTQKMQLTGFSTFRAMSISSRSSTAYKSLIQNNTIRNIRLLGEGIVELISLGTSIISSANTFNGDFVGNVIGSDTQDSSIYIKRTKPQSGIMYGVMLTPSDTDSINFNNNKFGGVYIDQYLSHKTEFYMLWTQRSTATVAPVKMTLKGNEFGSASLPRSVWNRSGGSIFGMIISTHNGSSSPPLTPNSIRVDDNRLSNFQVTGVAGISEIAYIRAIDFHGQAGATISISGNRIYKLNMENVSMPRGGLSGILCDFGSAASSVYNIKANTIYALSSLNASSFSESNEVAGIYLNDPAGGSTVNISRNLIHSLEAKSPNTNYRLYGIINRVGASGQTDNNMIRIGIDTAGNAITPSSEVYGVYESGGDMIYLHNTVYIGGSNVVASPVSSSSNYSAAFFRAVPFVPGFNFTMRNNIFVNTRSNQNLAPSDHYAVSVPSGLTTSAIRFNHNLYYAGSGGNVGYYNGERLNLQNWKLRTGQDANSVEANPMFVNPDGAASAIDLHLKPSSPAEGMGTATNTTATDFDGDLRSTLTPVDAGADAGNFSVTTSISNLQAQGFSVSVYPNPSIRDLFLDITSPVTSSLVISVFSSTGQVILQKKAVLIRGKNTVLIGSFAKLPSGTYLVDLSTAKGHGSVLVLKR